MAKTDKRGREWAPLPTSEFQRSPYEAAGDDMPKPEFVADTSQPAPGDKGKRNQTKSRSSKGGEK